MDRYLRITAKINVSLANRTRINYAVKCKIIVEKTKDLDHFFISACSLGFMDVAKSYKRSHKISILKLEIAFIRSCRSGRMNAAKWLLRTGFIDVNMINNHTFHHICKNGHVNICKWLWSMLDDRAKSVVVKSNIDTFIYCCSSGNLEGVKWLMDICGGKINIHVMDDNAFRRSCANGHIEVAKWLWDFGGVNLHAKDDYAFKHSCLGGHLDIVKWLHGLGEIDVRDSFHMSCIGGHLDVCKFIWSVKREWISPDEELFKKVCMNFHVDVARWLFDVYEGGIDMRQTFVALGRARMVDERARELYDWIEDIYNDKIDIMDCTNSEINMDAFFQNVDRLYESYVLYESAMEYEQKN